MNNSFKNITPKLKLRWEGLLTCIFSTFYMFFRAQNAPDIPKMASQRTQDGSQDVAKTPPRPPVLPSALSKMYPAVKWVHSPFSLNLQLDICGGEINFFPVGCIFPAKTPVWVPVALELNHTLLCSKGSTWKFYLRKGEEQRLKSGK